MLSDIVEGEVASENGYDIFEPTVTLQVKGTNVFHAIGIEGAKNTIIMSFREDAIRQTLRLIRNVSKKGANEHRYRLYGTGFCFHVERNGDSVNILLNLDALGPTQGVSWPQAVPVGTVSVDEWVESIVSVSRELSNLFRRLNPEIYSDRLFQKDERRLSQLDEWVNARKGLIRNRSSHVQAGRYTCPCCGYKTLGEKLPGTYDICPICFWEDDPLQFDDPDYEGSANVPSLRQAQRNFLEFGAVERRLITYVRKPTEKEAKDPNWKPVE